MSAHTLRHLSIYSLLKAFPLLPLPSARCSLSLTQACHPASGEALLRSLPAAGVSPLLAVLHTHWVHLLEPSHRLFLCLNTLPSSARPDSESLGAPQEWPSDSRSQAGPRPPLPFPPFSTHPPSHVPSSWAHGSTGPLVGGSASGPAAPGVSTFCMRPARCRCAPGKCGAGRLRCAHPHRQGPRVEKLTAAQDLDSMRLAATLAETAQASLRPTGINPF